MGVYYVSIGDGGPAGRSAAEQSRDFLRPAAHAPVDGRTGLRLLPAAAAKGSGRGGPGAAAGASALPEKLEVAAKEQIPICQDTGMAVVFMEIGQDVHFTGGNLEEAVV